MINQIKELLIFLIISLILVSSVCLFPGVMIYNLFHTDNFSSYSDDEITSDFNNIFTSDVDNNVKKSMTNLLTNNQERNDQKLENALSISVYYSILLSFIYILVGIFCYKKYGDKKLYLAQSFIFSGILLICIILGVSRFIFLNYI